MAYDEGIAETLRADLDDQTNLEEKKMFGGLCFMLNGHMLCGVFRDGGMYRVGKDREEKALTYDGVAEMTFTGRKMGGIVVVSAAAMADDSCRAALLTLAMENVRSLPAR